MNLHPVLRFAALLCAGASSVCWAQVAGDVYFKNSSVVAQAGGTAELEVQAFTGASRALGAVHLDVVYDASLLEVLKVTAGDAPEFDNDGLIFKRRSQGKAGLISLVALNSKSLGAPYGVVSFGKITVRPLAPAGQTLSVSLRVNGMLDTNSTAYAATRGATASVVVGKAQ